MATGPSSAGDAPAVVERALAAAALAAPTIPDVEQIRYQRPEPARLDDIARYYAMAEEIHWYSNSGPCHQLLALRLGKYLGGAAHCVPVSSCTLGLITLIRAACGEPTGHSALIAVPAFTFTASACAIHWAGFQPLLLDIEADSWQLDPDALDQALAAHRGRIAGVLGCSTFGTAPPQATRERWRQACARSGVPLLLDSAAGFGALDAGGEPIGGLGEAEVFSFHATKPFAVGEGGAIVTPNRRLAERCAQLVNFGLDPDTHASTMIGLNAKMSELQAAAALAMLDGFDAALSRRRGTVADLQDRIAQHPVTYQRESEGSTWQGLQLTLPDAPSRVRALQVAQELKIEAKTYHDPPLHRQPAFAGAARDDLSVTDDVAARSLSLPMANSLGERQLDRLTRLLDLTFA